MGKNWLTKTLIGIILSILLFLIGFLLHGLFRTSWSFSYKVEPIDLISILVTIFCATTVAFYINKRLSEERFHKELLIADLKAIEDNVSHVVEVLLNPETGGTEVMGRINYIRVLIYRIKKLLDKDIDTSVLDPTFLRFYVAATDFDTIQNTRNIIEPDVIDAGECLIIEVRRLIGQVNTK